MKMMAVDTSTGKMLMSNDGSMNEKSFKSTVLSSFPLLTPNNLVIISDGKIRDQDARIPQKRHVPKSKSVLWRGSFCLHPDTQVITKNGVKRIKNIVPGDMVFTHLGRFKKVLRTSQRKWQGKVVVIRTTLSHNELIVTPCHNLIGAKGDPKNVVMQEVPACEISASDLLFSPEQRIFTKVISTQEREYDGQVFDLQVEDDHTYTANGIAVHNSDLGGYANMNREICMRLPHHGFQVKIEMLKTGMQVDNMTQNLLRSLETTKLNNTSRCPVVVGFTPMSIRRMSRRTIFYTMMESQSLHPEFVNRCNDSADEIWVPGNFYADVFRKYGIIKPIHVMPLGVNHFTYTSDAVEPELRYEEMPSGVITTDLPYGTRFMSLFGWSYRKGPDVLCKSFLEEFDAKDDAYLVIYSRYMGSALEQHKQFVRDEINGYYKQCGKKDPPRIFYCGDEIPISDLPGCYAAADAFVFCSRGEGFGLILMEAGACETPIISTRNTAMTDFLDDEVAFCVEPDEVAPANDKLCWISEYYRDQDFVVLGDKAVAQCRRHMREVASNKKEASRRAQNFKKRIVEKYTWDACTARVARRLKVGT